MKEASQCLYIQRKLYVDRVFVGYLGLCCITFIVFLRVEGRDANHSKIEAFNIKILLVASEWSTIFTVPINSRVDSLNRILNKILKSCFLVFESAKGQSSLLFAFGWGLAWSFWVMDFFWGTLTFETDLEKYFSCVDASMCPLDQYRTSLFNSSTLLRALFFDCYTWSFNPNAESPQWMSCLRLVHAALNKTWIKKIRLYFQN